ncbi:MAG: hypothetical protein ABIH86_03415 [Planctomycetota bacterium]
MAFRSQTIIAVALLAAFACRLSVGEDVNEADVRNHLRTATSSKDPSERVASARWLKVHCPPDHPLLISAARDKTTVIETLEIVDIAGRDALPTLRAAIESGHPEAPRYALKKIASFQPDGLDICAEYLTDKRVSAAAARTIVYSNLIQEKHLSLVIANCLSDANPADLESPVLDSIGGSAGRLNATEHLAAFADVFFSTRGDRWQAGNRLLVSFFASTRNTDWTNDAHQQRLRDFETRLNDYVITIGKSPFKTSGSTDRSGLSSYTFEKYSNISKEHNAWRLYGSVASLRTTPEDTEARINFLTRYVSSPDYNIRNRNEAFDLFVKIIHADRAKRLIDLFFISDSDAQLSVITVIEAEYFKDISGKNDPDIVFGFYSLFALDERTQPDVLWDILYRLARNIDEFVDWKIPMNRDNTLIDYKKAVKSDTKFVRERISSHWLSNKDKIIVKMDKIAPVVSIEMRRLVLGLKPGAEAGDDLKIDDLRID